MIEMLKASVEWLLERYDINEPPVKVMLEAIEREIEKETEEWVKIELEVEKDYVWRDGEEVEVVKLVWNIEPRVEERLGRAYFEPKER